MSLLWLVIGIILFVGLVVIHEWGHFIAARRGGVEVEEFGIFFPPRLYKHKTKGGWNFTINALPLGGFVKLKGEHDSDTEKGSFGAANLSTKTKIMAAGVVMNLITALVLLTVVALAGMPRIIDNQFTVKSDTRLVRNDVLISYVEPGSPAAKAGLQAQDKLHALQLPGYSPVGVNNADELPKLTKSFAGKTVDIYYERDGKENKTRLQLNTAETIAKSQKTAHPQGYLGIVPSDFVLQKSTWSAPIVAIGLSAQVTSLTFKGLGQALAGLGSWIAGGVTGNSAARQNGQADASSQVSGPVGIFVILQSGSSLGYQFMLLIIGIISLTLAIMNILPIPALDGGRLWITLVSRALKRPLSARKEEIINATGFIALITLVILITIVDVKRFF
jgi:regulator of sigma E protease